MGKTEQLCLELMDFFKGDAKRIQHYIKVHSLAALIGKGEGLDEKTQFILETAALVHDMGIVVAEAKYGKETGALQEQEGPAAAEELLTRLGYEEAVVKRVSYLVGHHHTYSHIDGVDYQILVEADFLVNFHEEGMEKEQILTVKKNVFRTETGLQVLKKMYGIEEPPKLSETWAQDGLSELEDFIESQGVYIRQ